MSTPRKPFNNRRFIPILFFTIMFSSCSAQEKSDFDFFLDCFEPFQKIELLSYMHYSPELKARRIPDSLSLKFILDGDSSRLKIKELSYDMDYDIKTYEIVEVGMYGIFKKKMNGNHILLTNETVELDEEANFKYFLSSYNSKGELIDKLLLVYPQPHMGDIEYDVKSRIDLDKNVIILYKYTRLSELTDKLIDNIKLQYPELSIDKIKATYNPPYELVEQHYKINSQGKFELIESKKPIYLDIFRSNDPIQYLSN